MDFIDVRATIQKNINPKWNFNNFFFPIFRVQSNCALFFKFWVNPSLYKNLPMFSGFHFHHLKIFRKIKSTTCRHHQHSKVTGTMLFRMTLRLAHRTHFYFVCIFLFPYLLQLCYTCWYRYCFYFHTFLGILYSSLWVCDFWLLEFAFVFLIFELLNRQNG